MWNWSVVEFFKFTGNKLFWRHKYSDTCWLPKFENRFFLAVLFASLAFSLSLPPFFWCVSLFLCLCVFLSLCLSLCLCICLSFFTLELLFPTTCFSIFHFLHQAFPFLACAYFIIFSLSLSPLSLPISLSIRIRRSLSLISLSAQLSLTLSLTLSLSFSLCLTNTFHPY